MKYYIFAGKDDLNFDNLKKYMSRIDNYKRFAVFEINDENCDEFLSLIDSPELKKCDVEKLRAIGEDGGLYYFNCKEIVKEKDKSPISISSHWKRLTKSSKQIEKDIKYRSELMEKTDYGIIYIGKSIISGFNKFVFVDKSKSMVVPFRFKKARKSSQPLAVYFSGAGAVGHDNFKTLIEFLLYARGSKLVKKDCNILIPQEMVNEAKTEILALQKYTDCCSDLARILINEHAIDGKKIYAFGTSLGAKCVWRALLGNPDLYTAAVEAMGLVHDYERTDLEIISHIPVWLAHSSNDDGISIDSDDYCYDKLKSHGADVKYTRWDKYGHKMSNMFYRKEKWADWLLSKTK